MKYNYYSINYIVYCKLLKYTKKFQLIIVYFLLIININKIWNIIIYKIKLQNIIDIL